MTDNKKIAQNDNILRDDKGNAKSLSSDFWYNKIKLENYLYYQDSGKWEIRAKYSGALDIEECTETIQCNNADLLVSILSLKAKLADELFESPYKIVYCDSIIDEISLAKIVRWCKTNGYPFQPDIKQERLKPMRLIEIEMPYYLSFAVSDFIYKLNEIYSMYLLFQFITGLVTQVETDAYICIDKTLNNLKDSYINIRGISISDCLELFESKYKAITFINQISFEHIPHFEVTTKDLFDAAFYQLALLLSKAEKNIKLCPLCNTYFIADNGRMKYCSNSTCYPQKAYKRRKSRKNKKDS